MRYLGGKARTAAAIADTILRRSADTPQDYYEPFMGGGWVSEAIASLDYFASMHLSDSHQDLMLLWNAALFHGYDPADTLTKEAYNAYRSLPPSPERGWAGFAASYRGKWFGGYGVTDANTTRNYLQESKKSFMRKVNRLKDYVETDDLYLTCQSYLGVSIASPNSIVYCDPPYADTTGYQGTEQFDSEQFWDRMNEWAAQGHQVYVSEYTAPPGWEPIWQVNRSATVDYRSTVTNVESLYTKV